MVSILYSQQYHQRAINRYLNQRAQASRDLHAYLNKPCEYCGSPPTRIGFTGVLAKTCMNCGAPQSTAKR